MSTAYKNAGVNIHAGYELVDRIKAGVNRTNRNEVLGGIGGFGALFELSNKYQNPVLVSATDGVGTKLKIAFKFDKHDTVGIDLVAMSVNDILTHGAEPLFFLDYFACGNLNIDTAATVIGGIASGCEQAGCALIGGETAEMPDMYHIDEYDIAGCSVGVVEKEKIITGDKIKEGDIILGLASSGVHSNGFSLIRKIIKKSMMIFYSEVGNEYLYDELLRPTKIYVKPVLNVLKEVPINGIAHITGGGLIENIPRILPNNLSAVIQGDSWDYLPVFRWIEETGKVTREEMYKVFNCGIGMVLVVSTENIKRAVELLTWYGEDVYQIGTIKPRDEINSPIVIN